MGTTQIHQRLVQSCGENKNGSTWTHYVIKDAESEAMFKVLDDKKTEHAHNKTNSFTRLPPEQHYAVKDRVLSEGIAKRWVRFETQWDT